MAINNEPPTKATMPEFIFMLTRNDVTVPDAAARVAEVSAIEGIATIGFKDIGLPFDELEQVVAAIRACGRPVALEVVSLDENAELQSAEAAIALKVDLLMGGTHVERVAGLIRNTTIRYFPFPGKIFGHPSLLAGTQDEIVASACRLATIAGVHGLDLLAYRWTGGDPAELARAVVEAVGIPVIAAGDVDRPARVRALVQAGVYGFTVGSAAFNGRFSPGEGALAGQLRAILKALNETAVGASD